MRVNVKTNQTSLEKCLIWRQGIFSLLTVSLLLWNILKVSMRLRLSTKMNAGEFTLIFIFCQPILQLNSYSILEFKLWNVFQKKEQKIATFDGNHKVLTSPDNVIVLTVDNCTFDNVVLASMYLHHHQSFFHQKKT